MSRPHLRSQSRGLVRALVRVSARALVFALIVVLGLGSGAVLATPVATAVSSIPDPREAGIEFDTDLTLEIARCEGCVITLLSSDGVNPIYSSVPATVSEGSVTINLPSARTAGMSVRVQPPWLTTPVAADTNVVWRYAGRAIGDSVDFKEARLKRWASGCWAGTVNEAVTLTIKVRRVTYRGRPGAIAWAPVTESFLAPMEQVRGGVLVSDDVLACDLDR